MEARKFPRYQVHLEGTYRLAAGDRDAAAVPALSLNISRQGLALLTARSTEAPQTRIAVTLKLPPLGQEVLLEGRVVWSRAPALSPSADLLVPGAMGLQLDQEPPQTYLQYLECCSDARNGVSQAAARKKVRR